MSEKPSWKNEKVLVGDLGYAYVQQTNKNDSGALSWYVRALGMKNLKQPKKTLKLAYKPHLDQTQEIRRLAGPILDDWQRRNARNQPAEPMTMRKLANDFLKDARKLTDANELLKKQGKEPKWRVEQGSGYWNKTLLQEKEIHWEKYLSPFWEENKKYRGKKVIDITSQDVKDWQIWKDRAYPDLAPSTLNKQNSTLRHLFKLAVRQGENFAPPVVIDAKPNLEKRRRPAITEEQMGQVEDYLTDRWLPAFRANELNKWTYYPFLLHNYLELLKYTGVRPWQREANALRMEHIRRIPGEDHAKFLVRRFEKNHDYEAIASRRFIKVWDAVNRFYARFGITEQRTHFFVHPETLTSLIQKGQPIISFKKQWRTMMKYFGWNDDAREGEFEKLSFYSYRHAFITNKLANNKEISIWDLAKSTGTSIKMLEKIYSHFFAEQRFELLNAVDYDYISTCPIFSNGLQVGEVETNSTEHWRLWRKNPSDVAFAPIGEEK